jgi:hypothetical protein
MKRDEVKYLYFITVQTNVPSILAHGLLSHNRAKKLDQVDISMASVQDIRARKRVPGDLLLHDYAPLYICPRRSISARGIRCSTSAARRCGTTCAYLRSITTYWTSPAW